MVKKKGGKHPNPTAVGLSKQRGISLIPSSSHILTRKVSYQLPVHHTLLFHVYLVYFLGRALSHSNQARHGNHTRQHGNHEVLFERDHSVSHMDHFVGLPVNLLDEKTSADQKTEWIPSSPTSLASLSTHQHPSASINISSSGTTNMSSP